MLRTCSGKVKMQKYLYAQGVDDGCHNIATIVCEDCGKSFCHKHIGQDKHICKRK